MPENLKTIKAYMRRLPKELAQSLSKMDSITLREFAKNCAFLVGGAYENIQDLNELIDQLDWEQDGFREARAATAILILREESDPLLAAGRIAYEVHAALGDWAPIELLMSKYKQCLD